MQLKAMMSIPLAIAVVVTVAIVAIVVLVLRSRQAPPPAASAPPAPTPAPAARVSGAQSAAARPASGAVGAAIAGDLRMVCCQVRGAMHGAMPPFGKLSTTPTGLVFEANSRVISAAGDAIDSSDGATTMQSLGTMEMGQFRFEIPRAATQRVEFSGNKAKLFVDRDTFVLEGLGPSAKQLSAWLQGNGFDS